MSNEEEIRTDENGKIISRRDVARSMFDYVEFSAKAKELNDTLTGCAKLVENQLNSMPASRERALALTNLEQSIMWARKALREVK